MTKARLSLRAAGLAFIAITASATVAAADGWRIAQPLEAIPNSVTAAYGRSPFYLEPTFDYVWRPLGRFSTGRSGATNAAPIVDTAIQADGPQPGGVFGIRLPETWAPAWAGRNLRVEFSGSWHSLADQEESAFPRVAGTLFVPVGGVGVLGTGGTSGFAFRAEMTGYEAAVRIASDIAVTPSLTLSPAFGFFGGSSLTRYRMVLLDGGACPGLCFQDTVNERINARDLGGTFSLGARYALHTGMSLTLGGGVSIVHTHAKLNASDCFDATSVVDGCQPGTGITAPTTASATLNRWGYRLFGQAGVGFDLVYARLDVGGSLRYVSVVPEVRNPTAGGSTAALGSRGQLGYTVHARVSIPLDFIR